MYPPGQDVAALLLGHGALVLLFGFVVGFGFLFFLISEIRQWPIPGTIGCQLPGTNEVAFFLLYVGIVIAFAVVIAVAVKAFKPAS